MRRALIQEGSLKIFLAGRVAAESDGAVLDESSFPGRQVRLVFAYLVLAQGKPVTRHELADALWEDAPPATWDNALRVLVSKLRRALVGLAELEPAAGGYRLELPPTAWIDVLAAQVSVDEAEERLHGGELDAAIAAGALAESVLSETFLPGEDGAWVRAKRSELAAARTRALDTLSDASLVLGHAEAAARWAQAAVEVEPFRESGYRRLMAAHIASGNRAEALRVYDHCRRLLAEELGAFPSPETESMYRGLLEEPIEPPKEPRSHGSSVRPARRRLTLAAVALLIVAAALLATLAVVEHGKSAPAIGPNSLVRVDPKTLRVTEIAPVAPDPDFVVASGGYLWVTNHILREGLSSSPGLVNNTLTRVDPRTGTAVSVPGGLAPCGITPDPSGDVWVANCSGRSQGSTATTSCG